MLTLPADDVAVVDEDEAGCEDEDVRSGREWLWEDESAARSAGLYCRNAVNLLQWFMSILSVAPQSGCCVRKPYLLPMISPSKYVVRVGLSSVRPVVPPILCQCIVSLCKMLRRQTLYFQISAKERLAKIYIFDFNLDVVNLTLRLLGPMKPAAGAQERRR